jgi:hypothetical protein
MGIKIGKKLPWFPLFLWDYRRKRNPMQAECGLVEVCDDYNIPDYLGCF